VDVRLESAVIPLNVGRDLFEQKRIGKQKPKTPLIGAGISIYIYEVFVVEMIGFLKRLREHPFFFHEARHFRSALDHTSKAGIEFFWRVEG
jgi:hypothetical protein